MSTCPTNPIVTTEGSRDTGFCLRDTKSSTDDGLTNNQRFSNMAKNPQINRSCEEEVLLIDPSDTDSEDEDIDENAFTSLINEVDTDTSENLRDHLDTIPPTDDTTNTEAAMKLVSIASTAVEILETGVSGGSGCHYKPIKF
jgi:hypothetical protein